MIKEKKVFLLDDKNKSKVLIVDDLPTNIELLQVYLEEEGYQIYTASNGKEAIKVAEKENPDIILLDVMMPIMDGYEACRIIKRTSATENIPVVMVTSLNESSSRIAGIEAGADDFLSKPFNIYELLARVKSLIRIKKYYSQILDQNRVFEKELEIAKKVQEAILPDENDFNIDKLSFHYQYIPCYRISGDYFNFVKLSNNRIGIFLSDVMGHGVASSLITMVLKTLFDKHVYNVNQPGEFLFLLNNELQKIFGEILIYATAIYIIIDVENKKIYYANGAHPPALLFSKEINNIEELYSKGTILGVFKDSEYETLEHDFNPNHQILLYTDGITDVENKDGKNFGDLEFFDIVSSNKNLGPREMIGILLKKLYQFSPDESFEDDINLLCIRFDG